MQQGNRRRGDKLYEGKAKAAYAIVDRPDVLWFQYKDSLTAFNAQKKGDFVGKGRVNRDVASLVFRYLKSQGIDNHWVEDIEDDISMITRRVEIIPLEVVVRNVLAGSTAKKFQIDEGRVLETPLPELYYKDDELGDPFLSDEQALMLKAATQQEITELKAMALQVNQVLQPFFARIGLRLVDFKLEFGRLDGRILLADEVSPDTCRLWQVDSGEKFDKDRFRRDLGGVKESYEKVRSDLMDAWGDELEGVK